ncbi:MAG: hypothetical protein WD751_03590 [Anaerolineales bacterium]
MNRLAQEYLPLLGHYQKLKHRMLRILNDADLAHSIKGSPTLGELCKEIGETEQSYINSLKPPYKLNFKYRNADLSLAGSVSGLAAWYANMDKEMNDILVALSDEDLDAIRVGRGTWPVPIQQNLDIYKEALLIFAGKAWVHLHALGKELPEQWADWIG